MKSQTSSLHTINNNEKPKSHVASSVEEEDLERDVPLKWVRVIISLATYFMMLTDIYRTGAAIDQIDYPMIEPGIYSSFGPFNYSVIAITNYGSNVYVGKKDDTYVKAGQIWPYKYDSTSLGLRSILMTRNNAKSLPKCLRYTNRCDTLSIKENFAALDAVMDSLQRTDGLPSIVQSNKTTKNILYPHVRYSSRLRSRWLDRLNDVMMSPFHEETLWRSVRGTVYQTDGSITMNPFTVISKGTDVLTDSSHSFCSATVSTFPEDRPFLCEQYSMSFFISSPNSNQFII